MDKIELPILPATMTLKAALDLLRLMGRSALVTTTAMGARVVLDRTALLAKEQSGDTALGAISGPRPIIELSDDQRALDVATEAALDAAPAMIGIGEAKDGSATIYTRHEGIASSFGVQIGFCYCSGPEREICAPGDYPGGVCKRGHPLNCTGT